MRRSRWAHRLIVPLLLLSLFPRSASPLFAAGSLPCHAAIAPALVYSLNGTLYRVHPNGRSRCRLTSAVNAKEPSLSSNGQRVALLSGVGSNGYGAGAANTVRVARVGASTSPGILVRVGRGVHRRLAWSPNGQMLAFAGESGVWVWRVACRCVRLVMPETRAEADQTSTAWSPDSRRLAIAFVPTPSPPSAVPPWDHLRLSIVDVVTNQLHSVMIHFPAWLRGNGPYQESYPSRIIAWLPNGELLLGTSGLGVGLSLTGIWTASSGGGTATMTLGVPRSPRLMVQFPLLNATQALVSPAATQLLLNPGNRFWLASSSGNNGHLLNLGIHGSCALAQAAWVGEGHLAYVTVCTIAGSVNILARLYTLPLNGARPKLLASASSPRQDELSIAPPLGSIGCGGG